MWLMRGVKFKPNFFFTHYLVIYDIADSKRCVLVNKFLRRFLYQQQESCLEGELTNTQIAELKSGLTEIIDHKKDIVMIYPLAKQNVFAKQVFGKIKYKITRIF